MLLTAACLSGKKESTILTFLLQSALHLFVSERGEELWGWLRLGYAI
jgi:hypothetical protein